MPTLARVRGMVMGNAASAVVMTMAAVCVCAPTPCLGVTLSPGDLVVVDLVDDSVVKIDPATGAQDLISQGNLISFPVAVVVDPSGSIYVSVLNDSSGRIIRVEPATGAQTLVAIIGFGSFNDLEIDRAGNILTSSVLPYLDGGGRLMKVSPLVQHPLTVVGGDLSIAVPQGLRIDSRGRILFSDICANELPGGTDHSRVMRADQATGMIENISSGGMLSQVADIMEDDDGSILVLNRYHWIFPGAPDSIIRIDSSSGAQTVVGKISGLSPRRMARESSSSLVYCAEDSSVRRFTFGTGLVTTVSANGLLTAVTDIAVVPDGFESTKKCLGDTDGNGVINVNDVSAAVFQLGSTTAPAAFDTDGSGMVDVHDLTMIIFRLGTVCAPK